MSNSTNIVNTQSTDFVDIKMIECNRRFSEEVKGGNDNTNESRAIFTCKSAEIKVDIGDKISVANVFANQRGASSEVIQIDGTPVNTDHTITYTSTTGYGNYGVEGSPSGRTYTITSELPLTTIPQDNKCNLVINFYKNNNGENHISLPRSWVGATGVYPTTNKIGTDYLTWTEEKKMDGSTGMPQTYTNLNTGAVGVWPFNTAVMLKDDWKYVSFVDEDKAGNTIIKNQRIDNKRFKLFQVAQPPSRLTNLTDYVLPKTAKVFYQQSGYDDFDTEFVNVKDPATEYWYTPIKDVIELDVGNGYSAPVNVANALTSQMNKLNSITEKKKSLGNNPNIFTETISSNLDTPSCKALPCGSSSDWSEDYCANWRNHTDKDTDYKKMTAMNYNNNYEVIGFKRPEIVEAIRDNPINPLLFDRYGWTLKEQIDHDDRANPHLIKTSVPWSEDNIKAIKHIFDQQFIYSELWDWDDNDILDAEGGDVTLQGTTAHFYKNYINGKRDFSRYINIQATNNANMPLDYLAKTIFGTDAFHETDTAQDPKYNNQVPSNPLWIDYDSDSENFYVDSYQQNRMSYGFATKYSDGANDFIGMHVSGNLNGQDNKYLPNYIFDTFNFGGGGLYNIPADTKLGFDLHFSAFGHGRAIALYSGYLDWYKNELNATPPTMNASNKVNYQARGLWDKTGAVLHKDLYRITDDIRQIYIGANQPLINFDETSSRFAISQLHMSEAIGNNESAGSEKIQVTSDALNLVYKINKRSNFYNFCPDLQPYTFLWNQKDYSTDKAGEELQVVATSPYLDKYKIYDAHSGISIADWGYNLVESADRYRKNTWEDGLWSKLGYSQSDLIYDGVKESENNFNFRYDNSGNINNIKSPTTNAVVSIADTFNYVCNFFGNPIMTPQLPLPTYLYEMDEATPSIDASINIVQESSVLEATNYPKKMENGFFCIRSNIIPQKNYSGGKAGGSTLPVVAVCNKQNAESDFYFSQNDAIEYTATKPFVISEITTSIHKPNQELADLDDNSCVIYKIQKNIMRQTDLISDILESDKKNKK